MQVRLAPLAFVTLLFACGGGAAPIPLASHDPTPSPSAPLPATVPSDVPAELAPVASVEAAVDSVAVAAPERVLPAPVPAAETGGPAFVISTWEAGGTTLVVPVDPSTPARSVQRLLVLSPDGEVVVWVGYGGHTHGCHAGCAPASSNGLEGFDVVDIEPATFVASARTRGLFAREPELVESESAPEPDLEAGQDDAADEDAEGGEEEGCEGSSGTPASIVGGRLYIPLNYHSECGGWNIYGLDLASMPLFPGAPEPATWPATATRCDPNGATAEWVELSPSFDSLPCRRGRDGHFRGEGMCDECDHGPDQVVPRLGNGRLHSYGARMTNDANGRTFEASVPLTVSSCPSAADPCGPPARFAALTAALGPSDRYWVATSGAVALVIAREGYRHSEIRVQPRGADTPARTLEVPFEASQVISVRFHADAGALARVIDHGLGVGPGGPPPVRGATDVACELGTRREGPLCVALTLSPADAGFEDRSGGTDWGNRCATHLRAGNLDAAEAACARGLQVAVRSSTRGALWFNVGRIAERRGDLGGARQAYQRSLDVRPGNATVAAALEALGTTPR